MRKLVTMHFLFLFFLCGCVPQGPQPQVEAEPGTDTVAVEPAFPRIEVVIEKALLYDAHTLADTFPYRDTVRVFQWDKIRASLARLDTLLATPAVQWGILQNRNNTNGQAPLTRTYSRNAYRNIQDPYGTERRQGIPLYLSADSLHPERYGLDGSLIKIFSAPEDSLVVAEHGFLGGRWTIPPKYVRVIGGDTLRFDRAVFADRTNQCIATMERDSTGRWLVRSMNPCTTGRHHPPYQMETPLGIFVIQEKKAKMLYTEDGSHEIAGFAPYASRFCNGGYLHGVPVNNPHGQPVEWSSTLGTTPRSHMCVRNATSHAKFIYEQMPVERTLVFVIE